MTNPKMLVFRCIPVPCLFALLLAAGCAPALSPGAARIEESGKDSMAGCKYLGEVTGTSRWGTEATILTHAGKDRAKHEAYEKAAQLGGTHIVWRSLVDGYPAVAIGDVYLCGEPAK